MNGLGNLIERDVIAESIDYWLYVGFPKLNLKMSRTITIIKRSISMAIAQQFFNPLSICKPSTLASLMQCSIVKLHNIG